MAGNGMKRDAPTGSRPIASQRPGQQTPTPGGTPPWVVGLVAACVVLGGVFALRHALRPPAPEIEAVAPTRPPRFATTPRAPLRPPAAASDDLQGAPDDASAAGVAPGATPQHRAAPRAQPGDAGAPGARSDKPPNIQDTSPLRGALAQAVSSSVSFNGSTLAADSTAPLIEATIDFDSAAGAARFPPDAALAYPDSGGINLDEGSLAFWVRMDWDPTLPTIEGKALAELRTGTVENRFEIVMGTHFVSFFLTNADGVEQGVVAAVPWSTGDWHHVAATWGQSLMQIYADGSLADEHTYSGSVVLPPDTPLYVGSRRRGGEKQGTVSLRAWNVFQRRLTADEITDLILQTSPPPA